MSGPSARWLVGSAKHSPKEISTTALAQSALTEWLEVFRAEDGVDLICEAVRVALQAMIEFEATEVIDRRWPLRTLRDRTTERATGRVRGC